MDIDHQDKDGIIQMVDDAIQKGLGPCKIVKATRNTSLKRISIDTLFLMPDRKEMVSVKLRGTYNEWNELESNAERKLLYDHVDHLFNKRTRLAIKEIFKKRWEEFADEFYSIIQAAQDRNPLSPWKIRKASPYPLGFKSVAKQLYGYLQAWKPTPYDAWPVFLRRCFEEYHINPKGNPLTPR
ncbi:hypothetical protein D4S03_06445 [bacterium]|nr:MAG: hypothetical protein D4S03_06445 [bacterium]